MAILRKQNKERFTVIDNNIVQDKRLSLKNFGLLIKLLSLPDNWEFSEKGLKVIVPDGMSSIRSGLKDLQALGYLKRSRVRDEQGRLCNVEWTVLEIPDISPKCENPILDNPSLENHTQYTTKRNKTKVIKNESYTDDGISAVIELYLKAYKEVLGKTHRAINEIANIEKIEGYDPEDIIDIIYEYLEENKHIPSRCTIDYFCTIIDRYR